MSAPIDRLALFKLLKPRPAPAHGPGGGEAIASKWVLALMEQRKLTKAARARQMGTSRSSLDRLLDPKASSVTLLTIEKAARVLGKRLRIEMVEISEGHG